MIKYYVQCRLIRQINENSYSVMISWIPEKLAIKGKIISLKNYDGVFEDGWEVMEVWTKREASLVELSERDYLKQRKVSDI